MSSLPEGFVPDQPAGMPEGFVPDAAPAAEKPGKLEALLRGAKQGATMGFGDELTGLIESVFTDKKYAQARDEARAADAAAKEAHGGYFTAGELGGGAATALIPGGAVVKGAGLAANIARGAGAGIAMGIGNSEADLLGGDVGGVAKDAAVGGLVGGATGGVLGTVADKVLGGAAERVDRRLLGDITKGAGKKVRDKTADIAPEFAGTVRAHGLDKVAAEPGELFDQAGTIRKAIGARIGETFKDVDKHYLGADATDVTKALGAVKARYATEVDAPIRKQIETLTDNVKENWAGKRMPLSYLNTMIGKLEKQGFASADLSPAAGAQLKRDMAGALEGVLQKRFGEIQESAAHLAGTPSIASREAFAGALPAAEGVKALPALNSQYRVLKLVEDAAKQRARKAQFPPQGLRSFTLRGLGEDAYNATAGRAVRPADAAIAKLVLAAKNGDATAQMALRAVGTGVPRAAAANAQDIPGAALDAATSPFMPDDQPY